MYIGQRCVKTVGTSPKVEAFFHSLFIVHQLYVKLIFRRRWRHIAALHTCEDTHDEYDITSANIRLPLHKQQEELIARLGLEKPKNWTYLCLLKAATIYPHARTWWAVDSFCLNTLRSSVSDNTRQSLVCFISTLCKHHWEKDLTVWDCSD